MSKATGQSELEIFEETKTKFFLKEVNAQIEFIENEKGNSPKERLKVNNRTYVSC